MFNSLFKKIMGGYIIIPLFILIILIILLPQYIEDFLFQNKEKELLRKAEIVGEAVESERAGRVNSRLALFEKILDTGIIVINREGNIVNRGQMMRGMMHERHFGRMGMKNQNSFLMDREEIVTILGGRKVTFRGESPLLNKPVIAVGIPLNTGPELAMFLISPMEGLQRIIYTIRNLTLQVTAAAVGLALLLAYFIAGTIARPVSRIKNKAHRIAAGDFGVRLHNLPEDEIGDLGRSLNFMAGELEATINDLNTEKNRMQSMLTGMTEGVLGISTEGKIILANPEVREIFSLTESLIDKCPGEHLPAAVSHLGKRVLVEKEEEKIEFSFRDKVIVAQAAPVFRNQALLWGCIVLVRDVTRIRKLDEMRQLFVANVSHELKTPLTAVRGYTEAILDGVIEDGEENRRYLKKILQKTDRMSRLVGKILDLSRLQSGQVDLEFKTIELTAVIISVIDNFENRLSARKVDITAPERVYVIGDRVRIEQVLVNLLENAIKFTDEKGEIEVTVTVEDDFIEVAVIDNGPGIPEVELPYIWERFHQVDRSRRPDLKGTGLGLAIVKEIVEGLGGEVDVESKQGEGSRFIFTLRRADGENQN